MKQGFEGNNIVKLDDHRKETSYYEYMRQKQELFGPNTPESEKGHRFEERVLGKCKINANEKIPKVMQRDEAIQFAKDHQPEEKAEILSWLENSIAQVMREKVEDFEAFTAVGSPLDFDWGTDAFINAGGQTFTIDYTIGSKKSKERKYKPGLKKADLIFELDLDASRDEKQEKAKKFVHYAAGHMDVILESIREYQEGEREYPLRWKSGM